MLSPSRQSIEKEIRQIVPPAWGLQSVQTPPPRPQTGEHPPRMATLLCTNCPAQIPLELQESAFQKTGLLLRYHPESTTVIQDERFERVAASLPPGYKLERLLYKPTPGFFGLEVVGPRKLRSDELRGAREILGRPLRANIMNSPGAALPRQTRNAKETVAVEGSPSAPLHRLAPPLPDALRLIPLGACNTIGKSAFLLEVSGKRILIDCGGSPRDASFPPISPQLFQSIDLIILSHIHLDHSMGLPLAYRFGCQAPLIMSRPGLELLSLVLHDGYRVRKALGIDTPFGSRHISHTVAQARYLEFGEELKLDEHTSIQFQAAGHVLGAASVLIKDRGRSILYSGDFSAWGTRSLRDAGRFCKADVLICEATYGNRGQENRLESERLFLQTVLDRCRAGGTVIIPSFAVGRAQEILFLLATCPEFGRNGPFPVFTDGRLLQQANAVYLRSLAHYGNKIHPDKDLLEAALNPRGLLTTPLSSKTRAGVLSVPGGKVIVTTSGMGQGLAQHYIRHFGSDQKNMVLFVGYQAPGTFGRKLLDGHTWVAVDRDRMEVRAEVKQIGFSAHADKDQLLECIGAAAPNLLIPVHGDLGSIAELTKSAIGAYPTLRVIHPQLGQGIELKAYT